MIRSLPLASCLVMVLVSCFAQLAGCGSRPAAASPDSNRPPSRMAPLPGPVLRGFQVGAQNWQPGHRGIDLGGSAGQTVVAPAAGTISWVGTIAGVPMLTVQHPDGLRTTYQPVTAIEPIGAAVSMGQPIATLVDGHCATTACLHLGVRDGERYLDPLLWLRGLTDSEVRLLPRSAVPRQLPPPGLTEASEAQPATDGGLPAAGPITSGFGGRTNPISGAGEFHDGIDIGAPCGAEVQTLWPGLVTFVGSAGGFGLRVEVDHGTVAGVALSSSYSHLSAFTVGVGDQVATGTVIGTVGSTGFSTGCHLHYSTVVDGGSVDPLTVGR
ncbi:MAG: peptidoglycan DD-metalloendopeptidase family protein [Acidobacteriota bacterium]|nr:peptidoglycan DD-metalloendopeptidase family protein [Acidobacteriota bacterium]